MMVSDTSPASQDHQLVRVLIVDDTPEVRRDLHQFLDLTGSIEVIAEAANGQEALRLSLDLSPDVVVMDVEMPGMDGFEATCQIKRQQPGLRIVMLSVHADPETVKRALSVGVDEFVAKGASLEVLIDAILGRKESPTTDPFQKGTGN